jgi:heat shock protein HtpX
MRILLFLATNAAIILVLFFVITLLGLDQTLYDQGFPVGSVLVTCAIFGVGGSFISLLLSKTLAKRGVGAQVIEQPRNDAEAWLLQTVSHQAQAAGIGMPEVAIFPSDAPNAFATGANRDKALVAVSTGLLRRMKREEVAAVLGHEVSHVANGDMITLTLIQGVVNTFVFFFARVIGYLVDQFLFRGENEERHGPGIGYFVVSIFAQIVLGILASTIVFWFSRRREFRADAGGARLAGRDGMIRALERLKAQTEPEPLPDQLAAFGISGKSGGLSRLFMTHPPLEERIAALRQP